MVLLVFLSFFFLWIPPGSAELPPLQTHQDVWQDLVNGSWRVKNIEDKQTVEDFLFSSFLANTDPKQKIEQDYQNFIKAHKMRRIFPPLTNTLRDWQRSLNFIELIRFKEKFADHETLIHDYNFHADDMVKARSLFGIFYRLHDEGEDSYYESLFSGMLDPGQAYLKDNKIETGSYKVHTCLHGFYDEDISYIYFVPYGLDPVDDHAFQVKTLYYPAKAQDLNQDYINTYSQNKDNPYQQSDYLVVKIHAVSKGGETLDTAMKKNKIPYFQDAQSLPSLTPFKEVLDLADPEHFPKLFVIGLASEPQIMGSDYLIATNLVSSNTNTRGKKRSFTDDPEKNQNAQDVRDFLPGEFLSDYPTYPGMSGGPILECTLGQHQDMWQRHCRIKGINFGSERVFNASGALIKLSSIGVSIAPRQE